MFDPPPGYGDLEADAADAPPAGDPAPLEVPEVGVVLAARTRPASIAALAMAANPKLDADERAGHLARFVSDHLGPGEYDRLIAGMIDGELPDDTIFRVGRAIATQGTERPYVAVISLAVQTAYHWREIRRRITAGGVTDPMQLTSMHVVLDHTECAIVESMNGEDGEAQRVRFYDALYAPTADPAALGSKKPPPGFSPDEVEAQFDAFAALMR